MCWLDFLYTYSQEIKDLFSVVQSFFVSIGVIIGGVWAYWLFYKNRQIYPRANLSHEISHKIVSDDKIFLRVAVKISNVGNVVISLNKCDVRVQQILPANDKINELIKNNHDNCHIKEHDNYWDYELPWPAICHLKDGWRKELTEIESNEIDQFCFDFLIDSKIETISIYTYFSNLTKKKETELGWSLTTIYDIKKEETDGKRP